MLLLLGKGGNPCPFLEGEMLSTDIYFFFYPVAKILILGLIFPSSLSIVIIPYK
jgi:hypothetical protein